MRPGGSEVALMIRDGVRKFVAAEAPLAERRTRQERSVAEDRSFWERAAALGVSSLLVPEQFDGAGIEDPVHCLSVVAEEMGRVVAPGPLLPCNVVAHAIARRGTLDQQQQWLPGIAAGERVATWAVAEPGQGWLADRSVVRAEIRGDGYVLDGLKSPVEAAVEADVLLVSASSDEGPVQLLVPAGTPGVMVEPLVSLDLSRTFAEVSFSGARVPASSLVGDPATAAADVDRQVDLAVSIQAAETAAMMQVVLEMTVDYLQTRFAFGRPVASYQAIKHRLAEHRIWVESALGIAAAAAEALDRDDPSASRLASAAKAIVGDQALTTLSDCSQLFGGISMTWDHDHHFYFRRATVNRAMYGSPADHRERLCRLAGL